MTIKEIHPMTKKTGPSLEWCIVRLSEDENWWVDEISDKDFLPTLILCFFVGMLGIHRFYAGKVGTGILMLLTLGGLGFWTIIDFIIIVLGNFKDSDGLKIKN